MFPPFTILYRLSFFKLTVVCSVSFFSGCVSASQEESLRVEQEAIYLKMEEMLADKSCSTVADCDIIPVGSMACGGPASYVAYRKAMGADRIAELKVMAERSKQLDKKMNALTQMIGSCVYHSAPSLVCEKKQCATRYEDSDQNIGVHSRVE